MQEGQLEFDHLKDHLVEAPILAYPNPVKKYTLNTDTSDHNVVHRKELLYHQVKILSSN